MLTNQQYLLTGHTMGGDVALTTRQFGLRVATVNPLARPHTKNGLLKSDGFVEHTRSQVWGTYEGSRLSPSELCVKVGNIAPRLDADQLVERIQDAAWSCSHSWITSRFGESPYKVARDSIGEIRDCCRAVLASVSIHDIAIPEARQAKLKAMYQDYYGD